MAKLPPLEPRRVLQALKRAEFFVHHVRGSHYFLKHPDKPKLRISVPYHNKTLKKATISSIIKQTGMTVDEFLTYL